MCLCAWCVLVCVVIGHSRCSFDGIGQEFRTCYKFVIALTSVAFPWDLTWLPVVKIYWFASQSTTVQGPVSGSIR